MEKRQDQTAPFDEAANRWLAQWRNLDFSWDGLAQADWDEDPNIGAGLKCWRAPIAFPGSGKLVGQGEDAYIQATLQDYWRWSYGLNQFGPYDNIGETPILLSDQELLDAGLLVEWDNRLWHILHRPETSLEAAVSREHQGVVYLAEMLKTRFAESQADRGGADRRVALIGVRAQSLHLLWDTYTSLNPDLPARKLFIRSAYSEFENCHAPGVHFGHGATFERCRFSGSTDFHNAVFAGNASFDLSIFGARTDFFNAKFRGPASFARVVFGPETHFHSAQFGLDTSFQHARFGSLVDFGGAAFAGNAVFRGSHFGEDAQFRNVDFGPEPKFIRTKFGSLANFTSAKLPDAIFDDAKFQDQVIFQSADLSRAHMRHLDFSDTKIRWNGATVDDVEFADVKYEPRLLKGNCEGLKGGATIWGDALLRRDMQDQDYIDTLDARMKAHKPKWTAKPNTAESATQRLKRFAGNIRRALDPEVPPRIWLTMIGSAVLAGLLGATVVDQDLALWFQSTLGLIDRAPANGAISNLGAVATSALAGIVVAALLASMISSWWGKRAIFLMWGVLGYGRDWDRVALFALFLIAIFGTIYHYREGQDIAFSAMDCTPPDCDPESQSGHWFQPWFVAAMGFATLGISDVASPLTGAGQLLMIANVLAGFTIFGLLLAVLGNRFARRS
ncbi:MAG: pentapeptide repeat-containing protein [Pseudomonadota bacterium]